MTANGNAGYGDGHSGRWSKAKLTSADREEIAHKKIEGASTRELAAEYKVSRTTIQDIAPRERP